MRVLLPVVWALIATAIGLVLYRTSRAVVVSSKIRLGGAAAIAAVAFMAISHATYQGSIPVREGELRELQSSAREAATKAMELEACLATPPHSGCERLAHQIKTDATRIVSRLSRLLGETK
jgi:hypothetical protein